MYHRYNESYTLYYSGMYPCKDCCECFARNFHTGNALLTLFASLYDRYRDSISREYKSQNIRQGVSCLSPEGGEGLQRGGLSLRAGYRVAIAACWRLGGWSKRERKRGKGMWEAALENVVCTNIDGRYVLSWRQTNPRVALDWFTTPRLRLPVSYSLKVRSRVPIESCIKTTTPRTTRALGIFFFRCQLSRLFDRIDRMIRRGIVLAVSPRNSMLVYNRNLLDANV